MAGTREPASRQPLPLAETEEATNSDLDPPLGQNVLKEAPDELLGRQRAWPSQSAIGILVAEVNLIIDNSPDALVAEGDTEHMGRQMLTRRQTVPRRLVVHYPILSSDFGWYALKPSRLSQAVAKRPGTGPPAA